MTPEHRFASNVLVQSVIDDMNERVDPFTEMSTHIITLDTKVIMA